MRSRHLESRSSTVSGRVFLICGWTICRKGRRLSTCSREAGASYGYNGYDAGHAERRVADEAMQHFKAAAERLRSDQEKGVWERLIIGCQDVNWPDFEPHLHPYVKQRLIGRFSADVASVSNEEIRDHANAVLKNWICERGFQQSQTRRIGFAKANGRGVTRTAPRVAGARSGRGAEPVSGRKLFGARRRMPTLRTFQCAHRSPKCVACGHPTRELADVCDAIIPLAIRRDIELFYLKDNDDLDRAGNIAALLRFRSDQTSTGKFLVAS